MEVISEICKHGGLCTPSRSNRIAVAKRAGTCVNNIPIHAIFSLCNYIENSTRLNRALIKYQLRKIFPKHREITKHDTFNVCVKTMKLLPTYRNSNGYYEEFKKVVTESDLLHGIDNVGGDISDDQAYKLAHSLCLEVSETANNKYDAIFLFINYLELIKNIEKGFLYKLSSEYASVSSSKKKILGVIWKTDTIRHNSELLGSYISFDMMKRAINTLLWPYTYVTMYDYIMHLCIACEGILCGKI